MYGIFHIRSVSVGLDSQIWYLFIYITGYLNVRKMSETMDFRTFVGPLLTGNTIMLKYRTVFMIFYGYLLMSAYVLFDRNKSETKHMPLGQ